MRFARAKYTKMLLQLAALAAAAVLRGPVAAAAAAAVVQPPASANGERSGSGWKCANATEAALLLSRALPHAPAPASRCTLSLDSDDWDIVLDPSNPATKRMAAAHGKTKGKITVPGAWQDQVPVS